MIKEGKKYSYEELKKIFNEAEAVALEEDTKSSKEVMEKAGKPDTILTTAMTMQNMLFASRIYRILFEKDED